MYLLRPVKCAVHLSSRHLYYGSRKPCMSSSTGCCHTSKYSLLAVWHHSSKYVVLSMANGNDSVEY